MTGKRPDDMTEAELAQYYFEHRDDPESWGPPQAIESAPRLDSTISVRFAPGELAALRAAAAAADMKPTAFIRRSALNAVEAGDESLPVRAETLQRLLVESQAKLKAVAKILFQRDDMTMDLFDVPVMGPSARGARRSTKTAAGARSRSTAGAAKRALPGAIPEPKTGASKKTSQGAAVPKKTASAPSARNPRD